MKLRFVLFIICLSIISLSTSMSCMYIPPGMFDGQKALLLIQRQIDLGPRIPGSAASVEMSNLINTEFNKSKWKVEYQDFSYKETALRNIIVKKHNEPLEIIIGTHYDTRKFSDQENSLNKRLNPVPGANDGASGTALLIELAKSLDPDQFPGLGFVFFDAEDQGQINGWNWSIGAEYFVDNLADLPDQVIIVDMVGDRDLTIFKEINSDTLINKTLWEIANDLELSHIFIDENKYSLMDDHSPFLKKGVPAALLIDFDYPYWHTNDDTLDKVSAESLEIVSKVINKWLEDYVKSSN